MCIRYSGTFFLDVRHRSVHARVNARFRSHFFIETFVVIFKNLMSVGVRIQFMISLDKWQIVFVGTES